MDSHATQYVQAVERLNRRLVEEHDHSPMTTPEILKLALEVAIHYGDKKGVAKSWLIDYYSNS